MLHFSQRFQNILEIQILEEILSEYYASTEKLIQLSTQLYYLFLNEIIVVYNKVLNRSVRTQPQADSVLPFLGSGVSQKNHCFTNTYLLLL